MAQGYCLRCKTTRVMKEVEPKTIKDGRPGLSGECSVCGRKMFRIGAAEAFAGPENGGTGRAKRILGVSVAVGVFSLATGLLSRRLLKKVLLRE